MFITVYFKMLKQLAVLSLFLSLGLGDEHCDSLGVLLYEDIGCEPVKVEGKACPVSFKCPNFQPGNGSCVFKGVSLKSGERLDEHLTQANCRDLCICNDDGTFTCAIVDCAEHFGNPLPFGCSRTYTPGSCCSTGQRCAPVKFVDSKPVAEPIPDLAKCTVNGKDYLEGDKFTSPDSCSSCVCKKGFEGKFGEPFCKRDVCSQQIVNLDNLVQNCAPAYLGDGRLCCPHTYICPKDTDKIKQMFSVKEASELKCKFGQQDVKLGDGLETKIQHWGKVKDIKCECILPPLLSCKEIK